MINPLVTLHPSRLNAIDLDMQARSLGFPASFSPCDLKPLATQPDAALETSETMFAAAQFIGGEIRKDSDRLPLQQGWFLDRVYTDPDQGRVLRLIQPSSHYHQGGKLIQIDLHNTGDVGLTVSRALFRTSVSQFQTVRRHPGDAVTLPLRMAIRLDAQLAWAGLTNFQSALLSPWQDRAAGPDWIQSLSEQEEEKILAANLQTMLHMGAQLYTSLANAEQGSFRLNPDFVLLDSEKKLYGKPSFINGEWYWLPSIKEMAASLKYHPVTFASLSITEVSGNIFYPLFMGTMLPEFVEIQIVGSQEAPDLCATPVVRHWLKFAINAMLADAAAMTEKSHGQG